MHSSLNQDSQGSTSELFSNQVPYPGFAASAKHKFWIPVNSFQDKLRPRHALKTSSGPPKTDDFEKLQKQCKRWTSERAQELQNPTILTNHTQHSVNVL